MLFGLKGAPAAFQRTMDVVLSDLKYNICLCYLDDILVFSLDFESHLSRLAQAFHHITVSINEKFIFSIQLEIFQGVEEDFRRKSTLEYS